MASGSESFPQDFPPEASIPLTRKDPKPRLRAAGEAFGLSTALQIVVAYALIEATLWTTSRLYFGFLLTFATASILAFTFWGDYSKEDLGLVPRRAGTVWTLSLGLAFAAGIIFSVLALGQRVPADPTWPPLHGIVEYSLWAMVQQFILQAFFFVRMESLVGGKKAVILTSLLFAAAHLPSPVLTVGTLLGAGFFCESFRRYRNLFPIGMVHAILGLALAESVPDSLLHHMRVGISYWR